MCEYIYGRNMEIRNMYRTRYHFKNLEIKSGLVRMPDYCLMKDTLSLTLLIWKMGDTGSKFINKYKG